MENKITSVFKEDATGPQSSQFLTPTQNYSHNSPPPFHTKLLFKNYFPNRLKYFLL